MHASAGSPGHTPWHLTPPSHVPASNGVTPNQGLQAAAHSGHRGAPPPTPPFQADRRNCRVPPRSVAMAVVIISPPGHDCFQPLHAADGSPGHTPKAAPHHVTVMSAPGKHDDFRPMQLVDHSAGCTPKLGFSREVAPTVAIVSAAGHDNFRPLHSENASPGCTPYFNTRPAWPAQALASSAQVMHVHAPMGIETYSALHAGDRSPGHTPFASAMHAQSTPRQANLAGHAFASVADTPIKVCSWF